MTDLYFAILPWLIILIGIALLLFVVMTATAYAVWLERVWLGRTSGAQVRTGWGRLA